MAKYGCAKRMLESEREKHNKVGASKHVLLLCKVVDVLKSDNLKLVTTVESMKESMDKMMADNRKLSENNQKLVERVLALEKTHAKSEEEQKAASTSYDENTLPKKATVTFAFGKYNNENNSSPTYQAIAITEKGTRIRNSGTSSVAHSIVSTQGFNKGVNIWQIIANAVHCQRGVGICTELNHAQGSVTLYNVKGAGLVYSYHGNGSGYGESLHKSLDGSTKETYKSAPGKWNAGQTITIVLDCTKWQVIFWRDNTRVGDPIKIEANKTYYPMLGTCTCANVDYKLTVL